jgi:hypothetical protein
MSLSRSSSLYSVIREVLHPRRFFAANGLELEWREEEEEIAWEVFRGRLLDPGHTRQRRRFDALNVYCIHNGVRSALPLLSVKVDGFEVHVTRAILCRAWEGYDAGDNVILSRETEKWLPELVGTIPPVRVVDPTVFRNELLGLLFRAVVGGSRLPLTSQEAPLPEFLLGQLGYLPDPALLTSEGPLRDLHALVEASFPATARPSASAKVFETMIRAARIDDLPALVQSYWNRWQRTGHDDAAFPALLQTLFNEVSLTPYTGFVARTLQFLDTSCSHGRLSGEAVVDFLCHLLRQIGRHLTAYDLITFHHRGANYPDALLIDEVLDLLLPRMETLPDAFLDSEADGEAQRRQKRLRRRGLRHGWLLWHRYARLPVPDAPTSPGENARVFPGLDAVPEDQILNPSRRRKRLFDGVALDTRLGNHGREVLRRSSADLDDARERRELGTALFLDRPLGVFKQPGEPDQTPLLSYLAYSCLVAEQRLHELATLGQIDEDRLAALLVQLRGDAVRGLSVSAIAADSRPGVVSLADARQVDPNCLLLRTTRSTAREFVEIFDWSDIQKLGWVIPTPEEPLLLVRGAQTGSFFIRAGDGTPSLELRIDPRPGYEVQDGVELPAAGLVVVRAWRPGTPEEVDLGSETQTVRRR